MIDVHVLVSMGALAVKIAITGSYGAGKTSLVESLSAELAVPQPRIPSMTSPLRNAGLPATACAKDELIELLIRRLMDRAAVELSSDHVISDGSLMHDWVFVRTLLMHGASPDPRAEADTSWVIESIEPARRAIVSRMEGLYDVVVHLPIAFDLDHGPHPVTERFRTLSDAYLMKELRDLPAGFATVSGSRSERVQTVLDAIERSGRSS